MERRETVSVGVIVGAHGLGMCARNGGAERAHEAPVDAEAFDNTRLTLVDNGFMERPKDVGPMADALAAFATAQGGKLQIGLRAPPDAIEDDDVIAVLLRLAPVKRRRRSGDGGGRVFGDDETGQRPYQVDRSR